MSDLISRQAAIEALGEEPMVWCNENEYELGERNQWNSDMLAIKAVPSARPEIIRCEDCKHRPFDSEDTQGFGVEFPDEKCPCQCEDGWYNWRPNNEWFCANAERRTDEINDADALCAGLVSNHPVVIYAKSEPTVDAVPVVRCKDCKYYEIWQLKSDYTDDKRYKPSVCVRGQYAVHHNPDWFCAYAERRTV